MNTLFLKYALEINKTRSITKAAESLYMQQPNLSKAIKELEESVGYPIFERTSKGMVPTKQGEIFLIYAKEILDKIGELEMLSVNEERGKERFQISIPRGSYIANSFMELVRDLDKTQHIDFNVCETDSMTTIHNVEEKNFNLGIIRYPVKYEKYFLDYLESKNLRHEMIWEFHYVVVMSKENPLAGKEKIFLEDLETYTKIYHGDTEIPYYDYKEKLRAKESKAFKKINVYERGSQFDLLANVPDTYMWVSPLPERYLSCYQLVQRRCNTHEGKNGSEYNKDVLIYRKGYRFTELDKKFQAKLYESKIEVSSKEYS